MIETSYCIKNNQKKNEKVNAAKKKFQDICKKRKKERHFFVSFLFFNYPTTKHLHR